MRPKDVCEVMSMKEGTLRKYCGALEKAGYSFVKTDNGYREFTEKDVMTLEQVRDTIVNERLSLEDSIDKVLGIKKLSRMELIFHHAEVEGRLRIELEGLKQTVLEQEHLINYLQSQLEFQQVHEEVAATITKPSPLKRFLRHLWAY